MEVPNEVSSQVPNTGNLTIKAIKKGKYITITNSKKFMIINKLIIVTVGLRLSSNTPFPHSIRGLLAMSNKSRLI